MPTYIITKISNQVEIESTMKIKADSLQDAQAQAEQLVQDYNSLGNGHSTGWVVKSVIEAISPPPES
jgi:hypothetical protein